MVRRFTALSALGLLLALPSCADLISSPGKVTVILPSAAELAGIVRGVNDAFSRAAAGLGDGPKATELVRELASLYVALNAADATAADEAAVRAKAALADYRALEMTVGNTPDSDAIEIILLVTANSMKRPCANAVVQTGQSASFAKCT